MRLIEFILEESFGPLGRFPLWLLTAAWFVVVVGIVWMNAYVNHDQWVYYWTGNR